MGKFLCECGRCGGRGRYDRGTCFDCNGRKFVAKSRKPNRVPHIVRVNTPEGKVKWEVYASSKEMAVELVRMVYIVKGDEVRKAG
jgi:DnaJ-class molecular chaperone